MEGVIGTERWKEIDKTLKKVTQGDEELAERLSMMARGLYITGFKAEYLINHEATDIGEFTSDIFTLHLTNPNLSYEYVKNMQSMLLNCVALHGFAFECANNKGGNYNEYKKELDKLRSPKIYEENLDIVPIDDNNFASSEVARFCVFEHEGKKYCVNYFKTILDKCNELFKDMSKEDKEELNKYIKQVNDIFFNLKFKDEYFEVSKIMDNAFGFLSQNQFYRNSDQDFWDNLNSGKISFQNENLNKELSKVKSDILPHLYVIINDKVCFLNPHNANIPMFENVYKIFEYMQKLKWLLNKLAELSTQVNENDLTNNENDLTNNENDLTNYEILKTELQKYYFFFEYQYVSYVSFNEMPTKDDIQRLKEELKRSNYFKNELSKFEQDRLFDLVDTIDEPNRRKIMSLVLFSEKDEDIQKNLREIIQMILVSDISIEIMYANNNFGFKSLKGVIYQEPESDVPYMSSPGHQKININERLSVYLEDSTGQKYRKRMIFLPENTDISTAAYNLKKIGKEKELNYILDILKNPDSYKSNKELEKLREFAKVINNNSKDFVDISVAVYYLQKISETGKMSDILAKLTNSEDYMSDESREELVKIAKIIPDVTPAVGILQKDETGKMSDILAKLTNSDNYMSDERREELVKIAKTIREVSPAIEILQKDKTGKMSDILVQLTNSDNYMSDERREELVKIAKIIPDVTPAIGILQKDETGKMSPVLDKLTNLDNYRSPESLEELVKIAKTIREVSPAIEILQKDKTGKMLTVLNVLTNSAAYMSNESREELSKIAKTINNGFFNALYSQNEKDKKELEATKESLNKIKWWHSIFPKNRRSKKQLLSQINDLNKKLDNFSELSSQTFDNLIAYQNVYPEFNDGISKILESKTFSGNILMLADIINNDFVNVSVSPVSAKNLIENISKISTLGVRNDLKLKLIQDARKYPDVVFNKEFTKSEIPDYLKYELFKIEFNDPTGILVQNAIDVLESPHIRDNRKFSIIKDIYKLSQMCSIGVYPMPIHNTLAENNESLLSRFNKLHNEMESELKDKESPLQILAKINSEEKQNQKNQKISTR